MAIRIFFALLILAILGMAIASSVYILNKVEKPKVAAVREIKEATPPKPIDPGIGEFDAVLALIQNRQLIAARDKLRYIIRYFPQSARYQVSRRLCSEINLDMLISPRFSESKTTYEVRRGDALSRIAQKHGATLDYIKRVNGMMHFKIRPGDQFMVRPLNFKVILRTRAKLLTLMEGEEFFAEYQVRQVRLPDGVTLPFDDRILRKTAWAGESNLPVTAAGYDGADKQLRLRRAGLVILAQDPEGEAGSTSRTGFFMDPADVDEVTMLLCVGTPVHVAL